MPKPVDDIEVVPLDLPLDRETASWIAKIAADQGCHLCQVVAAILHDIRVDDELAEDRPPDGYLWN